MSQDSSAKLRTGFCIFAEMFCQGPVPVVSDQDGYVLFETELEAQKEIIDNHMTRLQEFLDGQRDYEDAISTDEFVVPVTVDSDGKIADEHGRRFNPRPE